MTTTLGLLVAVLLAADAKFPPLQVYSHTCSIETEYDRIRDRSNEEVSLDTIGKFGNLHFSIVNFYNHEKRAAVDPDDEVSLYFVNFAESWEFLKYRELTFLVDGIRLGCKEPSHDGDVHRGVTETMWTHIKVSDLLVFANAKVVEGKLGSREFRLTENQITAIRDFTARLGVTSDEAAKIARIHDATLRKIAETRAKAQADAEGARQKRITAILDAFREARTKASKAAQKLPRSKRIQRERIYQHTLAAEVQALCKKFALSLEELKRILADAKEAQDDQ